jgi:hypothetical protein
MTDQRDLDQILGAYFAGGTNELADRVIDAALDQIDVTQQRRRLWLPSRIPTMPVSARLAVATVIGVLAVAGAVYLIRPDQPSVGLPGPSPSASASPVASRDGYGYCRQCWSKAADMAEARTDFAATLLPDGRVFVVGGRSADRTLASAEIFDPSTGHWSSAGIMSRARSFPTATVLASGKVLVVGGASPDSVGRTVVDVYDPATNSWATTGETTEPRSQHAAALLADGRVLVAGGNDDGATGVGTAELYDPATGSWTATTNMTAWRASPSIMRLDDGRVLVTGGLTADGRSAELYDPSTNAWVATASMAAGRGSDGQAATKLGDGRVLVTGLSPNPELFDPAAGTWAPAGAGTIAQGGQTATTLIDGRILVTGGVGASDAGITIAQTFQPATGQWTVISAILEPRIFGQAVRLPDGRVLIAGGISSHTSNDSGRGCPSGETCGSNELKSAVIFDPAAAP